MCRTVSDALRVGEHHQVPLVDTRPDRNRRAASLGVLHLLSLLQRIPPTAAQARVPSRRRGVLLGQRLRLALAMLRQVRARSHRSVGPKVDENRRQLRSAAAHLACLSVGFISDKMILTISDVSIFNNFDC